MSPYIKIRLNFKGNYLKQANKAHFTLNNVVNLSVFYELDTCSRDLNTKFTLRDCFWICKAN